jgi:hypothetical protein
MKLKINLKGVAAPSHIRSAEPASTIWRPYLNIKNGTHKKIYKTIQILF